MSDSAAGSRLPSSSVTTVISLSLVVFVLGFLGFMILCARSVSDNFKENITYNIYLKDDAREADILRFQKSLEASPYIRNTEYISKEEALEIYKKELGEDFMPLLQQNVLPASLDIRLKADYANKDSVEWIRAEVLREPVVSEFLYQDNLLQRMNENIGNLTILFLAVTAILALISIALIHNTIRLAIYSKRFLIRTMQLVGATHGFITRPFIRTGFLQGLLGSILAMGMLVGAVYVVKEQFVNELLQVLDPTLFTGLFVLMLLAGIIISLASTFFAVRKYLGTKTVDLYR
ncbi:MAG: ABC transporter permease [Bacteroidia bacterium]|nr:ABC transporter permease [Bacteroidia bacterium]